MVSKQQIFLKIRVESKQLLNFGFFYYLKKTSFIFKINVELSYNFRLKNMKIMANSIKRGSYCILEENLKKPPTMRKSLPLTTKFP